MKRLLALALLTALIMPVIIVKPSKSTRVNHEVLVSVANIDLGELNEKIKEKEQTLLDNGSTTNDKATDQQENKAETEEGSTIITTEPEYIPEQSNSYTTRMTSFWPGDDCNSEDMTASGKSSKDFQLNDNGWYTYNNMLVIATASTRLGSTNQHTYNLYDQVTLNIQGITYQAIVLDVCGACQHDNRIDLFVKDYASALDTNIEISY